MLPAHDSPLRAVPRLLNERQSMFVDGIRYAIEMADIAYVRLANSLLQYSVGVEAEAPAKPSHAALFLDAWSIVDSVHRLRELVQQMPGVKKNSPGIQSFLRSTEKVEQMRHIAQHLRREVDALEQRHQPVHGILNWIYVLNAEQNIFQCCAIAAGKLRDDAISRFATPMDRTFRANLDHIELWIKDTELSLSDTHEEVKLVTGRIERALPPDWLSHERLGMDTFLSLDMKFRRSVRSVRLC